jgi:hypothetical protein
VAERVVDRLETVEVDEAEGKAGAVFLRPCDPCFELGAELAAVGQVGQAVEIGKAMVLVAEALGFCLARRQFLLRPDEAPKSR